MATSAVSTPAEDALRARAPRGPRLRAVRKFIRTQPIGAVSILVLSVLVFVSVFGDVLAPYSPTKTNVGPQLAPPSWDYPFGTDQFGRDILSRIIHGSRVSLAVGLISVTMGVIGATVIGTISGYLGGRVDYVVQRVVDAIQAFPSVILLVVILVILGQSLANIIIALSLQYSFRSSRVVRGAIISLRNETYVEAARSLGATQTRVMVSHLLPNIFPTMMVLASTSIGAIIVAEASLSFLGFGVPPPMPSWGGMLSAEGRVYMLVSPWLLIVPTVALSLVVFSVNMLGDAVRDVLDPRMRGR